MISPAEQLARFSHPVEVLKNAFQSQISALTDTTNHELGAQARLVTTQELARLHEQSGVRLERRPNEVERAVKRTGRQTYNQQLTRLIGEEEGTDRIAERLTDLEQEVTQLVEKEENPAQQELMGLEAAQAVNFES